MNNIQSLIKVESEITEERNVGLDGIQYAALL